MTEKYVMLNQAVSDSLEDEINRSRRAIQEIIRILDPKVVQPVWHIETEQIRNVRLILVREGFIHIG